jgi:hypothetical protein
MNRDWRLVRISFMTDRSRSPLSKSAFEFLLTDIDTALTFMDIAGTTDKADIRKRNYANAYKAYDAVRRFMQNPAINHGQRETLASKLSLLKSRLQDAGQMRGRA